MKVKTNNNSKKKKTRRSIVAELYTDLYTGRQKPVTNAFFERLAEDFVKWATEDKRAIRLNEFAHKMGIPWSQFQKWGATKEPLKRVYEDVKLILATRREKGMVFKEMSEKANMHVMHRYDPEWQEADKYHSELRSKEYRTHSEAFLPYLEAIEVTDNSGRVIGRKIVKCVEGKPQEEETE